MSKLLPQKKERAQVQDTLMTLHVGESAECSYTDFNILSVRATITRLNARGFRFNLNIPQGQNYFIVTRNR